MCEIKNFLFPHTHAVCFIFSCSDVLGLQNPTLDVNFYKFLRLHSKHLHAAMVDTSTPSKISFMLFTGIS